MHYIYALPRTLAQSLPATASASKMSALAISIYLFFRIATGAAFLHAGDNAVGSIWTFPNETWIENLAARENGMLLCTTPNRFAVFQVDPFGHTAVVVHQFDSGEGVLGITEVQNDIWIVATSNVNLTTSTAKPGSAKIWKLDMGAWSVVIIPVYHSQIMCS